MGTLEYIPATAKVLRMLSEEPRQFAEEHGVLLHQVSQSVAEHSRQFLKSFAYETRPRFLGYLVVDGDTQEHVGVCSFKGPPVEGTIEIAFYTFPGHEGRGIATAMARFLVDRAREMDSATRVMARTVAEPGPATRVLEKAGLEIVREVEEEGIEMGVWEIELKQA